MISWLIWGANLQDVNSGMIREISWCIPSWQVLMFQKYTNIQWNSNSRLCSKYAKYVRKSLSPSWIKMRLKRKMVHLWPSASRWALSQQRRTWNASIAGGSTIENMHVSQVNVLQTRKKRAYCNMNSIHYVNVQEESSNIFCSDSSGNEYIGAENFCKWNPTELN